MALQTLTNDTTLSTALFASDFGEDIYIISLDANYSIHTLTAGQVPIVVGWAHGDLTNAEISEAVTAEQTDPDDIIAREKARRPVRTVGVFAEGGTADMSLNDGVQLRTKIKFSVGDGHGLNFWVFNRSDNTLTTGAVVSAFGTLYGRWQR